MYLNEQAEFGQLIRDLFIAVDRPLDKDIVRVFWEDLQDVPLQAIQRQVAQLRTKGVKRFTSNDLRPPATDNQTSLMAYDNNAIIDRLNAHMLRTIWPSMSPLQRLYKRAWVYTRDRAAPRCIALKIEPDREEKMINGELRVIEYPGHFIRHEDCDADFAPTRENLPLAHRDPNWNEADAARDLLNRKS